METINKIKEKKKWFNEHKVMKLENGEFIFYRYEENGRKRKNYLNVERFIFSMSLGIIIGLSIWVVIMALKVVTFSGVI